MSEESGRPLDGTVLPAADVARIIDAIAAALDSEHSAGTVRGTLTPAAIVVRRDERSAVSAVGLAEPAPAGRAWMYAAPEVSSSGWRTAASDQYSLACIAYQLLSGRPPFDAADETGQRIAHASSPAPRISRLRPELAGVDDAQDPPTVFTRVEVRRDQVSPTALTTRRDGRRSAMIAVLITVIVCGAVVLLEPLVNRGNPEPAADPGRITGWGTEALNGAMDSAARRFGRGDTGLRYIGAGMSTGKMAFGTRAGQFLGADAPLTGMELDNAKRGCGADEVRQIPLAVTPLAIVYNLPGVNRLILDIPTIAGIFGGSVTKWNDPAIVVLGRSA